jgi:NAD(P)-dependent dehydrogenase (short-subunit alcohol dehydrogenase family)
VGRVIAAKLAADGFDVAVAHVGNVDLADATVGEIRGHCRRGAAFAADADEEATSAVSDAVGDCFGHHDVVATPPGSIAPPPAPAAIVRNTGAGSRYRATVA